MRTRGQVETNYVGLILILYFYEDQRSFIVVVGHLANIGSVFFFFIQVILYFGLDHRVVVMLSDFS